MKKYKIISIVVLLITLSLAGYFAYFKTSYFKTAGSGKSGTSTSAESFNGRETLTYVPADTLFFYGGIKTIPLTEITAITKPQLGLTKNSVWTKGVDARSRAKFPPAVLMIMELISKNILTLQQPDAAARLGVGTNVDMVGYSVGFIPVLRIKLADAAAFNKYIDEVEQAAELKSEQKTISNVSFRAYSFDMPGDKNPSDVELLIGVNKGYAIFTLFSNIESTDVQNLIAGTTKPASSLATSTMLPNIEAKYLFLPSLIAYINHREIINGITSANGNEFSRMLDTLVSMTNKARTAGNTRDTGSPDTGQAPATESSTPTTPHTQNVLKTLRTQACRVELTDIVNRWPKTVFGYTRLDLDSTPHVIQARMLIENTDPKFMHDLQKLRGYIPAMLRNGKQKAVFGLGLGLNVDAVSPFISNTIQGFIAKDYKCEYLMQLKQKLLTSNPARALAVMTAMANGLRGISASIIDIDGSLIPSQPGMPPDIKTLDAIFTVSATDPQRLLTLASTFLPGKQALQLPADGSAIDFPMPFPLPTGAPVKLALKGNTIVAYTGDKAEKLANSLSKEPIQPNGIMSMDMDFGKYMKLLSNVAQNQAALPATGNQAATHTLSDQDKQTLAAMAKLKMQYVESLDIDTSGIAFDVKMTSE